jgi:hypothetical protein
VLVSIGVQRGSTTSRAVFSTINALEDDALPGPGDYEARFARGRAHVRRVPGSNVWLPYRFDTDHVFVLTFPGIAARREFEGVGKFCGGGSVGGR